MKKIYFVRHAESLANADLVNYEDPQLSPRGELQADQLAKRFAALPVDLIISSHLLRAKQTAQAIVKLVNTPHIQSELFAERRPPSATKNMAYGSTDSVRIFERMYEHYFGKNEKHSDEESHHDIIARASAALKYLEGRPEEHLLIVTHGVFLRAFIGVIVFGDQFTGSELYQMLHNMKTVNTGITFCEFTGDNSNKHQETGKELHWRLIAWNDHAHLG